MPRALPPPFAAFSAREVRLLAALAPVLLPAGGGLARSHADVDWLSFAQRYAAEAPPQMRLLLKATLLLLGSLGWAWAGCWPAGFSQLHLAERERVVSRWRSSRFFALRGALQMLSLLFLLPFYQDAGVLAEMQVPGGYSTRLSATAAATAGPEVG